MKITSPKMRHQNDVTIFFYFQATPLANPGCAPAYAYNGEKGTCSVDNTLAFSEFWVNSEDSAKSLKLMSHTYLQALQIEGPYSQSS